MKTQSEVWSIVNALKELYPDSLCSLHYEKDYELLFAVRLSAQCTDARVNMVTPALFARFPTLEAFAEADPKEVGEYIHSCGFYNSKSRDLVACAQMLLRDFGGKVPREMDDLLKLPGVGRKTANLVRGGHLRRAGLRGGGHPLHPHHRPHGPDRRHERPRQGGGAAAGGAASGGVQQLLPPDGAPWPGGLHRPEGPL